MVVALAVAAMIGLGLWQLLDRAPRKEAYLAQLAGNPAKPPIAFPRGDDETALFRRTTGVCPSPVTTRLAGAGSAGFRVIATCGGGTNMIVQLGTTPDPAFTLQWPGGPVRGFISHAPDSRSLIGLLFDHSPSRLMLITDTPAPGLGANGTPDLSSVPNNHLSYAVQWFFFAAIAAVIYVLAVRRRA